MKPPVKKTKVATRKDKDGSQQWESNKFRNTKEVTEFIPKNKPQKEKIKIAEKLGTARAKGFTNTGAMRLANQSMARAGLQKRLKKPAGGK